MGNWDQFPCAQFIFPHWGPLNWVEKRLIRISIKKYAYYPIRLLSTFSFFIAYGGQERLRRFSRQTWPAIKYLGYPPCHERPGYLGILKLCRWACEELACSLRRLSAAIAYPTIQSIASLVRGHGAGKDLPFQLYGGLSNRAVLSKASHGEDGPYTGCVK